MRPILSLYILRQHFGPFLFAILVITFLFIMDLLIDYIDLFLGKGIALPVVLEVFVLSLGWMIALTVPMSVLVATVMAFGRLSADNEITAMRSAGISVYQIIAAPLLLSLLLTYGLIEFGNQVLPESNHRLSSLLVNIHRKRPTLAIKVGMFNDIQGYTIRVQKLYDKTSRIEGVTIQRTTRDKRTETIVADNGILNFSDGGNMLTLLLRDGEIHTVDEANPSRYHRIVFDTHTIRITDLATDLVRSEKRTRGDRELSASAMHERVKTFRSEIENHQADQTATIRKHLNSRFEPLHRHGPPAPDREAIDAPLETRNYARRMHDLASRLRGKRDRILDRERQANKYLVEMHKKYSLPAACIVFVLVGAPLGIKAHRGGLGVGTGLSIAFFMLYYLFLLGGEKLADRGYISPSISMWAANVVIGTIGIVLVVRSSREMRPFSLPKFRPNGESDTP